MRTIKNRNIFGCYPLENHSALVGVTVFIIRQTV